MRQQLATTLNKSEIMRAAWVIVRRFKGDLAQRPSRALSYVWWDTKEAARIARNLAARAAASAAQFSTATVAQLRANLWAFECKDTMRGSDWQRLDAARAALTQAEARAPVAA